MSQEALNWALLLGRWVHITTAMAWIGTSFFFMWLDRSFEGRSDRPTGHLGDLWMVHGGGFYHVEKLQMGPTRAPEHLHWFKWESYWTWMSGFFLLTLIFYVGSGNFLIDSSVSGITHLQAVALGLGTLVVSWLFYDFIWESRLTKTQPLFGHIVTLLWFIGVDYMLCHLLSGRAAYLHTGAMLGTWMTGNVFLRIIPRQVKMVEAAKNGEPVREDWSKNAKNRSTHNTYFTLPVIFIMLSNHFPSTYGHPLNWLILLLISAAGACIREFFVVRIARPARARGFAAAGVALIAVVIAFSRSGNTVEAEMPVPQPIAAMASVPPATSGTVHGIVRFDGNLPKPEKLALPLDCGRGDVYADDLIVKDGRLKNAVVRIVQGLSGPAAAVPSESVEIDQRHCMYDPRVIAVRAGQTVVFTNSDAVFHNVRSLAKDNEAFNVPTPNKGDRFVKVFNKPEIFQTKCSVHPWMTATIAVIDHPFFSVTNDAGEFSIKGLPPGSYTLEVWHETLGSQTRQFTLKENETQDLDFTFKR